VDESPEDLRALVAEGLPIRRGTGGDDRRRERDHEGEEVGEHVPGIREQRERTGEDGPDGLDHQENADYGDSDDQARAVCGTRPVIVGMSLVTRTLRTTHPLQARPPASGIPATTLDRNEARYHAFVIR